MWEFILSESAGGRCIAMLRRYYFTGVYQGFLLVIAFSGSIFYLVRKLFNAIFVTNKLSTPIFMLNSSSPANIWSKFCSHDIALTKNAHRISSDKRRFFHTQKPLPLISTTPQNVALIVNLTII